MVVIFENGDVCEDAEYYGIFHNEEIEEIEDDFIDDDTNEDLIYHWEYKLMLV